VAYDFFGPKIGFDIFRFEDGLIVEHWDNPQEAASGPDPSGHTMTDGPTMVTDLDRSEANKALMRRYMDDLLGGRRETFPSYFNGSAYIQHNPWVADTIPGLLAGLKALAEKGKAVVYKKVHMVLGEGDFSQLIFTVQRAPSLCGLALSSCIPALSAVFSPATLRNRLPPILGSLG
jgi:predicted SnoaL-like aldol condensation-catalyzing enzyme